jgi:hypothetical protein
MAVAALLIAGGGLQAFAAIKEGQIAEAQGKFAKQIAVRNQQALERQAEAEKAAAGIEETRIARRGKIVKAAQRAIVGKSGVGLAGATLSLLADTAFQFSLERNLILRRGLVRGRELRERGQIELAKGRFAFTLGRQAKKLSFVKAGASILGSVGGSPQFGAFTSGVSPGGAMTATGRTSSGGFIFGR